MERLFLAFAILALVAASTPQETKDEAPKETKWLVPDKVTV